MKLRVVAVGKDRSGLYAPAVEEYAGRIARYVGFSIVEVPEARKHAGTPRARDEEGETILARLGSRERVVLLDERGTEETSEAFARRVGRWLERGQDVALVVGGADGLSDAVRARADETLALSRMTLAHRLARLVLVEQLYRALTILRGERYHRA
jgi:23S rRNA (pseudouridine1915-N3)-methyltransferase